jgi:hypothetical protein
MPAAQQGRDVERGADMPQGFFRPQAAVDRLGLGGDYRARRGGFFPVGTMMVRASGHQYRKAERGQPDPSRDHTASITGSGRRNKPVEPVRARSAPARSRRLSEAEQYLSGSGHQKSGKYTENRWPQPNPIGRFP